MKRLQNTDRVWSYIHREWQVQFGDNARLTPQECVLAVLVVSALTKMLRDDEERERERARAPRRRRND